MHDRQQYNDAPELTGLDLIKANIKLGTAKAALVVPTQWMQVIMRVMQGALIDKTNPELLSMRGAARRIIAKENPKTIVDLIRPFFRGTMTGASKELIKGVFYKGALIKGAPSLAEKKILKPLAIHEHVNANQFYILKALSAGLIAAGSDVVLGGALESAATFRATAHGHDAKTSFIKEVFGEQSLAAGFKRAYRGAGATMVKGTIAFDTLFLKEKPIETWVVKRFDVKNPKKMPWDAAITNALLSGMAVAVTSAPFDIVKTQAQMPNPTNLTVVQGILVNYSHYGVRGITAGIVPKSIMITLGWGVTKLATSFSELSWREDPRSPSMKM